MEKLELPVLGSLNAADPRFFTDFADPCFRFCLLCKKYAPDRWGGQIGPRPKTKYKSGKASFGRLLKCNHDGRFASGMWTSFGVSVFLSWGECGWVTPQDYQHFSSERHQKRALCPEWWLSSREARRYRYCTQVLEPMLSHATTSTRHQYQHQPHDDQQQQQEQLGRCSRSGVTWHYERSVCM